jgi:hypothetical protein
MWGFLFCQFDFTVSGSNMAAKTQGAASLCQRLEDLSICGPKIQAF